MKRLVLILILFFSCSAWAGTRQIQDATGRSITIPEKVTKVICSGSGCLRLLTYLQGQHLAVGVDDIEKRLSRFEARPYALANPQFKKLPLFGQFRGHDNPEQILSLEPSPQVIFKTYSGMGYDPLELQDKTGIPVIVLNYGDLTKLRPQFYQALQIMGSVLGKEDRAKQVIDFFETEIADIKTRASKANTRPSVFIGGVAFKGPHGYQSTEPAYPPFIFLNANAPAYTASATGKGLRNSNVAKEKIVAWNPEYLFLDLSTLQMGSQAGGLFELQTDPAYQSLDAVYSGKVYGVLPYNWYTKNYGSILADAYFIGKTIYPEQFMDIDPAAKADQIYSFLVARPVFKQMNSMFADQAFSKIRLH